MADGPIPLPSDLVASVRQVVGPDGVTDYVVKAVERMLKNHELARILGELEAEAEAYRRAS